MTDKSTGITGKTTDERTPFSSYLIDIDKGRVESDATDAIADAVRAVEETGGKATVTVTLTIEPQDKATFDETGILVVTGDVKHNLPRVKRPGAIFYTTGVDGQMSRTDPNRGDGLFG